MNLVEMNDKILTGKKNVVQVPTVTQENLTQFKSLMAISKLTESAFDSLEDANAFYKMFPYIKKLIGTNICVEVFYACKLGYYYENIPAKLTFILNKAVRVNGKENINATLNPAVNLLRTYAENAYEFGGKTITVKDVIENIVGAPVSLISSSTPKIKSNGCWEVFIPNAERVALFPDDIGSMLSYSDCEKLEFDIGKGIMLEGIPIRTFNNRIGITKDDFDLRECI